MLTAAGPFGGLRAAWLQCHVSGFGGTLEWSNPNVEHVSGKITRGQDVAYDNVNIWIDVHERGSVKSWNGGFTLPPGTFVELGETYRVHLRDGRQGDMLIRKISVGSHKGASVLFQGTGPLAR